MGKIGRPRKDLTSPFYSLSNQTEAIRLSLVLYCPFEFLREVLFLRQIYIDHYAFIFHDCDKKNVVFNGEDLIVDKEPHFHLLLFLTRKFRVSTVLRWFYRLDSDGRPETVTCTGISNPELAFAYLTHTYDYDKYQYPSTKVKCDSRSFFDSLSQRSTDDSLTNAFYDRLAGATVDELIKKYGRDFIIHYDKILHLCRISALERESNRSDNRLEFFNELYEIT